MEEGGVNKRHWPRDIMLVDTGKKFGLYSSAGAATGETGVLWYNLFF